MRCLFEEYESSAHRFAPPGDGFVQSNLLCLCLRFRSRKINGQEFISKINEVAFFFSKGNRDVQFWIEIAEDNFFVLHFLFLSGVGQI